MSVLFQDLYSNLYETCIISRNKCRMMKIKQWNSSVRNVPQLVSLRLIRPLELNREKGSVKTRKGESSSWRERLDHMSTLELMYWAALLCQPTWYFYSTDWTYKRGSRNKMSLEDTEVRITCQTLDLSNECLLCQPQREQSHFTGNKSSIRHSLL